MKPDEAEKLLERFRGASRRSLSVDGLDEALALLERISQGERLPHEDGRRLMELTANPIICAKVAESLAEVRQRRTLRVLRDWWRPISAAAAMLILCVGVRLFFWPTGYEHAGQWSFADFTTPAVLFGKGGVARPEGGGHYESRFGMLRDRAESLSPDLLEDASWNALKTNHLDDAITFTEQWATERPADPVAINGYGVALLRRGDFEKAKKQFLLAYELAPENVDVLANLLVATVYVEEPADQFDAWREKLRTLAPKHEIVNNDQWQGR